MNYKSIFPIILVLFASIVLISNICFAQDGDSEYTTVFSADRIDQWETSGMVVPDTTDGLSFIFPYDEHGALEGVPDTISMRITESIDLSRCRTAYIRYDKSIDYPNDDSWLITNIEIYVRHEYNRSWVRVFENISELAGWIHELDMQFKIVVKTDNVFPASLKLSDFIIEGACGL